MKTKIKPLRKKCDCGRKVKNHHLLCDSCWGKKAKEKHKKKKLKLLRDDLKNKNKYYGI